jgi:hypothetical protein
MLKTVAGLMSLCGVALRAPSQQTPPCRAGLGFFIGGRNFKFLLAQVVKNRKGGERIAWFQLFARRLSQVVFRNFSEDQRRGHFSPWGQVGGCFGSAYTATIFSAGPGRDILKYCAAKQRIKVLEKIAAIFAGVWYVLVLQRR